MIRRLCHRGGDGRSVNLRYKDVEEFGAIPEDSH